ncbi:MAG TPA: hypothetical protein VGJ13_13570, partial [Pseudonocardiaceae bacterium]
LSGQQPGQRGEDRSVRPGGLGPAHLATQYRNLVAQRQHLGNDHRLAAGQDRQPPKQAHREQIKSTTKKWTSTEVMYAVTSLTADQATARELATWIRGHWAIDTRLHWVRDVTHGEDHSQVRTRTGPRVWDPHRPIKLLLTS